MGLYVKPTLRPKISSLYINKSRSRSFNEHLLIGAIYPVALD